MGPWGEGVCKSSVASIVLQEAEAQSRRKVGVARESGSGGVASAGQGSAGSDNIVTFGKGKERDHAVISVSAQVSQRRPLPALGLAGSLDHLFQGHVAVGQFIVAQTKVLQSHRGLTLALQSQTAESFVGSNRSPCPWNLQHS